MRLPPMQHDHSSMKIIFSLSIAFCSLLGASQTAAAQAADSVMTVVLKVTNLHCNGDMPTIKKRLLNQDGIDEVHFTDRAGETSEFTVSYHTSVTSQAAIEKAIETTPGCDDQTETPYRVKKEKPAKKKRS